MPATYTTRRSVAMTPQLRARLQQLLAKQGKDVTEADLIRQAIREFLDRQEDITGSRAQWDLHAPPRDPGGWSHVNRPHVRIVESESAPESDAPDSPGTLQSSHWSQ